MKPTTIPGFHTPSFTMSDGGVEHRLFASDGCGWCDKRHSAWRVSAIEAPPPKSKLLVKDPNWIDITPWLSDSDERDAMDNEKPIDAEWEWGKA